MSLAAHAKHWQDNDEYAFLLDFEPVIELSL